MDTIGANLQAVKARIERAATRCGRHPQDVSLIAVSKGMPLDAIVMARAHNQTAFGESYVQEALAKMADLSSRPNIATSEQATCGGFIWHYLGPIQSNKTKPIAENFAWVHSVDRLKIAERLSSARPHQAPALQICIEVNVAGETTKHGVTPRDTVALARAISNLPRLRLRGLMTIPPAARDEAEQHRYFAELRALKDHVCAAGVELDTLSMGMSDDFEVAIAEGATTVRVGTAIFGERAKASLQRREDAKQSP